MMMEETETPIRGGLYRLQQFAAKAGFDLTFCKAQAGVADDLSEVETPLNSVPNARLFNLAKGYGLVFRTVLPSLGPNSGLLGQSNTRTFLEVQFAPTDKESLDFYNWAVKHSAIIKDLACWGKQNPSFMDTFRFIFAQRRYVSRVFPPLSA